MTLSLIKMTPHMMMIRLCLPGLRAADDTDSPAVPGPENGETSNSAN